MKKEFGIGYQLGKLYFRIAINGIFYRRYYCLGKENIPAEGTPVLVAMNHQNCLNDALGVFFAKNDRKFHFIARADAFDIHPLLTRFMQYAGVLPAYRLDYQGEEALADNNKTFEEAEQCLLDGHTVLIFPEAGHRDKHWLGTFSYGYTRLAFQAAEKSGFQREIFILPAANHYSAYTGLRNRMLVRFGTPVSLQPYYELYKEKPRTAQREVNRLVRAQIEAMMLDIQDLDHYADIDFVRTLLPRPNRLPEQLEADQALVHRLEGFDFTAVGAYRQALENDRLQDSQFTDRPNWGFVVADMLLLLLLLPLAILALWPSLLCWYLPKYFSNRLGDVMLQSSFHVGLNVLVLLPLSFCLTWLITGLCAGCWIGLAHALLIGPLCIFEWYYAKLLRDVWRDIRFLRKDTAPLAALRAQALSSLKTE